MERIDNNRNTRNTNIGALFFGMLCVFIGAMLVTKQYHWLPYPIYDIVFSWQMLLIVVGLVGLISGHRSPMAFVLIGVGLFFMLSKIPGTDFEAKRLFWPFIFILVGILILTKRGKPYFKYPHMNSSGSSADFIEDTVVFGGGRINVTSRNFQGGRITSIFGGSEYYFHQAELAEGVNVIEVFHIFGGSKLVIPSDWNVKIDIVSIFGGYSDKRINVVGGNPAKELYIKGFAIFGGGDIKSA